MDTLANPAEIFSTALHWQPKLAQNSKSTRFIWVFMVLGIRNFVNSWCGCGKTAWCDARIDISKWIFIAIDVHFKPLPESFSMAGFGKFHLKIKKCVLINNQFVTANQQTTNLVFLNFFHEIFSVEKENKLFIGPKLRKICFRPIKSLLSFSTAQTEKSSWKKLGKTKLVVWWIDVTNKINYCKAIRFASFLFNKLFFWFMYLASHQPIWLWRTLNGEDFYTKLLIGPI